MVAQRTLTPYVRVQILLPLPTEEAENFKFSASFLFPAFCAKGFAYKYISVLSPIPVNRHFLPNAPPASGETGGVPPCTKPAATAAGFSLFCRLCVFYIQMANKRSSGSDTRRSQLRRRHSSIVTRWLCSTMPSISSSSASIIGAPYIITPHS